MPRLIASGREQRFENLNLNQARKFNGVFDLVFSSIRYSITILFVQSRFGTCRPAYTICKTNRVRERTRPTFRWALKTLREGMDRGVGGAAECEARSCATEWWVSP